MKLVVDTNVLITYFWKDSVFAKLLHRGIVTCIAPDYALEEINKHREIIRNKSKHTSESFKKAKEELAIYVEFVPIEEYHSFIRRAVRICPDPNDADFFALALKEKLPLWSNDIALKKQKHISVLSTSDLLSNKEFLADIGKRTE